MPSLWHLPATTTPDRRALHRRLATWLDTDHHAPRKPWSWTHHAHGIEIGLLDDTLTERLRARAGDLLTPVSAASWTELATARRAHSWRLQFVSPVTFRRGNRLLPMPSPSAVLGSLRSTWRHFATPHTADLTADLAKDPVFVTSIDGTTTVEKFVLHDRTTPGGIRTPVTVTTGGFLGTVTYATTGGIDPAAVSTLFALAPYAGIGAHTTRGFGGTRPAPQAR